MSIQMVAGLADPPYLDRSMISDTFDVLPTETPFPRLPDGLPAPEPGMGEVVALVSEMDARADGWAASLVVQLARHWSREGRLVILADADWTAASLNVEMGPHVGEGLSDLVLYGTSPVRVAQSPPQENFRFIPAGTVVGDPDAAWLHPRWPGLLKAFRDAGTVLLLHLPAGAAGAETLAASADRVFRLARDPEFEGAGTGGVVIRASAADGAVVAAMEAVEAADEGVVDEAARAESGTGERLDEASEVRAESGVLESQTDTPPRRSGIPAWVPLAVLLAIVIAIVLAAWLGILAIPGITPGVGGALSAFPVAGPADSPLPG